MAPPKILSHLCFLAAWSLRHVFFTFIPTLLFPFQALRRLLLTCFFRVLIFCITWVRQGGDRYEAIFLGEGSTQEKESLLIEHASGALERVFIFLYLCIPFPNRDDGYHIHALSYIALTLHSHCGLIDSTFKTDIDGAVCTLYAPLRHFMAESFCDDQSPGEEDDKTIAIFRLANHFVTVKSIHSLLMKGVTRPVNVHSQSDMSNLYYDVLQRRPCALASEADRERIVSGKLNIIALSYRHFKDHRYKLGISKRELIAAVRALHQEAAFAEPSDSYCLWWDSCLNSGSKYEDWCNWAAVGLTPYAFCHVLSVRRDGEESEQRLWIDVERALGRLGKGMTVVNVSGVEDRRQKTCNVAAIAPGCLYDPENALEQGLMYITSGDVHCSSVSFAEDKRLLLRAGMRILVAEPGIGAMRALFDVDTDLNFQWVDQWDAMEEKLLPAVLEVWLGKERFWMGSGEAELSSQILLDGPCVPFDDRRMWLPNSEIYGIFCRGSKVPSHVRLQAVLRLWDGSDSTDSDRRCGVLLSYREADFFTAEAIIGCVVTLHPLAKSGEGTEMATGVSRLHVSPGSSVYQSFKDLYVWARESADALPGRSSKREYASLGSSQQAVEWIWSENEMAGDSANVMVQKLHKD